MEQTPFHYGKLPIRTTFTTYNVYYGSVKTPCVIGYGPILDADADADIRNDWKLACDYFAAPSRDAFGGPYVKPTLALGDPGVIIYVWENYGMALVKAGAHLTGEQAQVAREFLVKIADMDAEGAAALVGEFTLPSSEHRLLNAYHKGNDPEVDLGSLACLIGEALLA